MRYRWRSEEHTSELQSHSHLVCRLLLEKKKKKHRHRQTSDATHLRAAQRQTRRCESLVLSLPSCHSSRMYVVFSSICFFFFFFNDTATTEIYPLPLHDALPI